MRIARVADGWFPSVGLESGIGEVTERLHQYMREEGRKPSELGIEGAVSIAKGGPDTWVQQIQAWKAVGASHITVHTDGPAFASVDDHVKALERFMEAVVHVAD